MAQQVSQWVPLSFALIIGGVILTRHRRITGERRSFGQWLIFSLYKVMRFLWAIVRGVDIGYLEFRQVLNQVQLESENEKSLGKMIRKTETQTPFTAGLRWVAEESGT